MKKAQFIEGIEGLTAFETAEAISKFMAQSFVTEKEYDDGKISLDDIIPFISNVVAYTDYVLELDLDSDWKNIVDAVKNAWKENISCKSGNIEKINGLLSEYKSKYPKRAKIAEMYEKEGEFRKYNDWVDWETEWQTLYNNFNKATGFSDKVDILVECKEKFFYDKVKIEPELKVTIESQFPKMLKVVEDKIENNPGVCSYMDAKKLFKSKLFTEDLFYAKDWMTPKTWEDAKNNFMNSSVNISIDNVVEYKFDETKMRQPDWDKYKGATDVFFFGIPATGKTCLLMGLVGLDEKEITLSDKRDVKFSYNSPEGGLYFVKLHTFLDAHCTPGSTYEDFMVVVRAQITCGNETHKINLIELAGENFQKKVVKIEAEEAECDKDKKAGSNSGDQDTGHEKKPTLDDFGPGLTAYLRNTGNPKIFFCVLDPTQETIKTKISPHPVRQGAFIKYFINILSNLKQVASGNEWLDLVSSIYVILTKSDSKVITDYQAKQRNTKVFDSEQFINDKFQEANAVATYCGVDLDTGIMQFSLADKFYVGDCYVYNDKSSKEIIKTIFDHTDGVRKMTRIDHLLEWFNTPLFS